MKIKIFILFILVSTFFTFFILENIYIRLFLILISAILILLLIANIRYKSYIKRKVPNIMENLTRNYEGLILGASSKYYNTESNIQEKVLDLTTYRRNLYTDILILKRWYSFLDENGIVYFNVDCSNRNYLLADYISIFDDEFIHQVTLMEHGKDIYSRRYRIIKILKSVPFLLESNFGGSSKYCDLLDEEFKVLRDRIIQITSFCKERNIKVKINYYNCSDEFLQKININN